MLESRSSEARDAVRRRRECRSCGYRFTTYESVEKAALVVVKSSGERQPFDREKLMAGLRRACHKRQVPTDVLEAAVTDIEAALRSDLAGEVPSAAIGDLALRRLRSIDQVAYVRFASVYRQFANLDEFAAELSRLELEPPLIEGQPALDEQLFHELLSTTALSTADPVPSPPESHKETA